MNILISNDDGVYAPGLRVLASELTRVAEITVVAPDRNRSGASNSLTLASPLRINRLENGYVSVEGTPTDCVHLALTGFLDSAVDMVVSGINDGANLGDDVIYSGTVAAAMEGRNLGFPALAFSMVSHGSVKHYTTGAAIARQLIFTMKSNVLPQQTILNINIPDIPLSAIKGMEITRLGTRHNAEPIIKAYDPRGEPVYWVGPPGCEADAGPGTDFNAVRRGYVSITPLHIDMTHYAVFDKLASWIHGITIPHAKLV